MTETEGPHFLEALYGELSTALGDAVWSFARIEWLTYEFLGKLSSDSLDKIVGDVGFRARSQMLKRLIDRSAGEESLKKDAKSLLGKAEDLAQMRNIFVHNPWTIWIDLDAQEFMTELQKYKQPDKKVGLEELRKFIESCQSTEAQLRESLGAL